MPTSSRPHRNVEGLAEHRAKLRASTVWRGFTAPSPGEVGTKPHRTGTSRPTSVTAELTAELAAEPTAGPAAGATAGPADDGDYHPRR